MYSVNIPAARQAEDGIPTSQTYAQSKAMIAMPAAAENHLFSILDGLRKSINIMLAMMPMCKPDIARIWIAPDAE